MLFILVIQVILTLLELIANTKLILNKNKTFFFLNAILLEVTILVLELVSKYWDKELRAVALRNEGNKLFAVGGTRRVACLITYGLLLSLVSKQF